MTTAVQYQTDERVDWTNATHAHGPALAEWMEQGDRLPEQFGHNQTGDRCQSLLRAVSRWARGENPSFESVDRWLTFIGYHPSEVPDECWTNTPSNVLRGGKRHFHPPEIRARAIEEYVRSGNVKDAAMRAGVGATTLRTWIKAESIRSVNTSRDLAPGAHAIKAARGGTPGAGNLQEAA